MILRPPYLQGYYERDGEVIGGLNSTACYLFNEIRKGRRLDQIVRSYLKEIGKPSRTNENLLFEFFKNLEASSVIEFTSLPFTGNNRISGDYDVFYPRVLTVELTDKCNLFCRHCYNESSNRKNQFIDADKLMAALDEFGRHELKYIQFTGGEPMLHPHFDRILMYSCRNFERVYVLTNGTLVTEEFVGKFTDFTDKLIFSVSLDGPQSDIHDVIRGKRGSFDLTTRGARLLRKSGFKLRIAFSFDDRNFHLLHDTFKYSMNVLDATQFAFSPIVEYGRGHGCWSLVDEKTYSRLDKEISRLMNDRRFRDRIQLPPKRKAKSHNCGAGYKTFAICPDGEIKPCTMFPQGLFNIGNMFTRPLGRILGKENLDYLLNVRLDKGEKLCEDCEYNKKFCQSCLLNRIVMYSNVRDKCKWGDSQSSALSLKCNFEKSHKIGASS